MSIVMRELNVLGQNASPSTNNLRVPGPFSLADEKMLQDSLQKAGFKDIQIERQNITFEYASVNDYIKHLKDIAAPLKAILDKESASRQEEICKMLAKKVK